MKTIRIGVIVGTGVGVSRYRGVTRHGPNACQCQRGRDGSDLRSLSHGPIIEYVPPDFLVPQIEPPMPIVGGTEVTKVGVPPESHPDVRQGSTR